MSSFPVSVPGERDVLLVDTNRGSYPLLVTLTDQGWNVSVVGADPDAPLAKLCPRFIQVNYADDQKLASLVAQRPYSAIIPGCTDASYLACAALPSGPRRGLDENEAVRQIFNKHALRQLARHLVIRQPVELSHLEALKSQRVLIKPVDGFSGAGITLLEQPSADSLSAATASAAECSPCGGVLIEEFVEGQLYSHSAFLKNQQIVHDFFVREDCIDFPYAVDSSCLALDLPAAVQQQMRSAVQRVAQDLQLKDGLIHTQFIERDAHAYLLEITRRHPGDLYGLLIQLSTGFDYTAHYLNAFLPQPCQPCELSHGHALIIRHTITAGPGRNLWSLRFHAPVMIRKWIPLAKAGDRLSPAPQGRAAIIFLESADEEAHREVYEMLTHRSLYSFDC
jgi:hypothetical protein